MKTECLFGFLPSPTTAPLFRRSLIHASKPKPNCALSPKPNGENDPSLQAAINAASLRFIETHRSEPLFVDPYADCFVEADVQMDLQKYSNPYCVATRFIDDKLLRTVNHMDGLKQVVLFSDGMDTRPYRLNWPASTIIFEISSERIFKTSAEKLKGYFKKEIQGSKVGAKVPRSCLLLHVPLESSNIQQSLLSKGFDGNRPSIWAIQGLPVMTLASFEEILSIVASLAMNESLFLGELPAWLAETEMGIKSSSIKKWLERLFMNNGFRVGIIDYDEVARGLGKELAPDYYKNILFVAEQLRFSDDQMETWRIAFQRVEEDGDEDGFEEL